MGKRDKTGGGYAASAVALDAPARILVRVTTVGDSEDEGQSAPGDETRTGLTGGSALDADTPTMNSPENAQWERQDRNHRPEPGTVARQADGLTGQAAGVADHEKHIRNARSHFRWMRDCGSAAIVGGATVALTLMLAGLPIQQDVFIALEVIYGLLVIGANVFWWRARASMGQTIPREVDYALVAGAFIIGTGVLTGLDGQWPIMPHTGLWWSFIAVALVVTITGATRRQIAEAALERLKG